MDQLIAKILNQVDAAGGRIAYKTVHDSLEGNERALLPKAIKRLKSEGTAMNQNRRNANGELVFEIFRIPPSPGGG